MSAEDKAKAAVDKVVGKAKEVAGEVTGNDDLAAEGKRDQAKGNVRDAAENVKDAAKRVTDQ